LRKTRARRTARLVPLTTLGNLDPVQSIKRRLLKPSWILDVKPIKGRAGLLTLTLARVLVIVDIPLPHQEESRMARAQMEKPKTPRFKMR
jgi:hypothetical protein